MNIIRLLIVSIFLVFPLSSLGQGYLGLLPMHSNCDDAIEKLKITKCDSPTIAETENETIIVNFSKDDCQKSYQRYWHLPENTIVGIEVILKKKPHMKTLNFDLTKFTKKELPPTTLYSNPKDGLSFAAMSEFYVAYILFMPNEQDSSDDNLKCSCQEMIVKGVPKK